MDQIAWHFHFLVDFPVPIYHPVQPEPFCQITSTHRYLPIISLPKMSINANLSIELTSRAIEATPDNYYNYYHQVLLFQHEPIRRELERGLRGLEAIDLSVHPWKAKYVHVWLVEFFIPMILDHHDSEEKHMGPFYTQRGVKVPNHLSGSHSKLVNALERIGGLSESFSNSPCQENLTILKTAYFDMHELMKQHLEEEERFWPDAVKQIGEEEYSVFFKEMHTDMKNQPSGHMFLMSALDSMGYEFDGFSHVAGDTRWCGDKLLEDLIINKVPYFVRTWIFPPINRKYQHYKSIMCHVSNGLEDSIPLKYEEGSYCSVC